MFSPIFHQSLAKARNEERLSLRTLASIAGISLSRLSRLERGERVPTSEERAVLASLFPVFSRNLRSSGTRPRQYHRRLASNAHSFLDQHSHHFPPFDRTSEVRYHSARRLYPKLFDELVSSILQRQDFDELNFFCSRLAVGSSLECMFLLRLLAQGAIPAECAPVRLPFSLPNQIVCPRSRERVGHRAIPCLSLIDNLWFPQISFSTPRIYTVDFLVFTRDKGWSILEIDGAGHDASTDRERTLSLGLPVQRLAESQVLYDISEFLRAA